MRRSWSRSIARAVVIAAISAPLAAGASTVQSVPNHVSTAIASDLRETIDRAVGYKRPTGATYTNGRGEVVSPRSAASTGVPRVHFTLLGSDVIATSINKRLRGMFGQKDATKTSRLTPTNQR